MGIILQKQAKQKEKQERRQKTLPDPPGFQRIGRVQYFISWKPGGIFFKVVLLQPLFEQ